MQWRGESVGSNFKQVVMVGLTEKVPFEQSPKGDEVAIGLAGRKVVLAQGIVCREALRQEDVVRRSKEEEVRLERLAAGRESVCR